MADERRRTGFGAVVLGGLAAAALSGVAAAKPWFRAAVDYKLLPGVREPDRSADMPLALALSLVVLAGWGVLLVTRGRMRRAVAGVSLVAGAGVVLCVVAAPFTLPGRVRDQLLAGSSDVAVSATGWYVAAAVASILGVVVLALAWRLVPHWPTMGSRYDAPAARTPTDDTDLWKALDEGRDPTDPAGP